MQDLIGRPCTVLVQGRFEGRYSFINSYSFVRA
jgi:hypothetical protein